MTEYNGLHRTGLVAVLLVVSVALAGGLTACSDDDSGNACEANLLPGDLVITEVMPNPEGADDGKEWFEVYNATSTTINLRGLTLVYSRADGTSRKTHVIESASIDAGQYMVFGGIIEVAMPAYMDYAYADDLGSLTNTGGRLALECNATLVDDVVYLEGASGVSISYDGRLVPDAIGNDTITDWCDSESEYEVDNLGTPGAANDQCAGGNPTGTCLDGGVERDIVPPQAGDVVITELMPNPAAVDDGEGEWVEVYFAQAADLNGLQLGDASDPTSMMVGSADCIPVAAGTYVVFARNADSATNGGLTGVSYEFGFTLNNTSETVSVGYDDVVLDEVSYASSEAGASISLDSAILDATQNDDATNWCDAVDAYGDGDLGTPGAANPSCGFIPPDTCIDPISSNSRDIVPPVAGDVIITEFMPNPAAVSDTAGEWFEVYFAQDADLNGLQLGDTGNPAVATVTSADCIPVTAGTYVVFARNADSAANGGLTDVALAFTFTLSNSAADSITVGYDNTVFDEITFSTSSVGASTSLSATALDDALNDNPGNWCDGVASYGDGDLGTPGLANPTCP